MRTRQIIDLLLLLPAGALLTIVVDSAMKHPHRDNYGAGVSYGHISADLNGNKSYFFLAFEGESKPEWYWAKPENYSYQSLELKWSNEGIWGKGVLDLRSLVLTTDNSSFTLSEAAIADMLRPESSQDDHDSIPTQAEVAEVYSLLTAAGQGTLPPPSHYGYSLRADFGPTQPLGGRLSHFWSGFHAPHALTGWCVIWIVLVVACFIRSQKSRSTEPNHSMQATK